MDAYQDRRMKGSLHGNWRGGRKIDPKGYVLVLRHGHPRADSKGYVKEHLLIAESAVGKAIHRRHQVHHVNEIKGDNSATNLVICEDQAYHQLLHIRTSVLRMGGSPDLDKICTRCKAVKPRTGFSDDATRHDGLRAQCRECAAVLVGKTQGKKGNA